MSLYEFFIINKEFTLWILIQFEYNIYIRKNNKIKGWPTDSRNLEGEGKIKWEESSTEEVSQIGWLYRV